MMAGCRLLLSETARAVGGRLQGADGWMSGVSTDTRKISAGELFVALRGPTFDGHNFVLEAWSNGAVAVMVDNEVTGSMAQIIVPDTRLALAQLAGYWRAKFSMPVIAVTGSNGKTTVKEMIAAILRQNGEVCATTGNLNNEIGVPLTLLRCDQQHGAAVIEEGASHPGDIAYLTRIVQPTVAVVTNAGGAHLQGFGSLDVVARTKGEIYQHMAPGGIAVINADDAYAGLWRQLAGEHPVVTFGLSNAADIRGHWNDDHTLVIDTRQGRITVRLPLEGRHNAMNALAAAAATLVSGATLQAVQLGLEAVQPVAGRLQWKPGIKGARILDDTYNANPVSLTAALEVLAHHDGERYLALGDMAELGDQAVALHEQAGRQARASGVKQLYAVGELSRYAVSAFGEKGFHFPAQEQLISRLKNDLHDRVALLVKGSRSARMEKVVAAVIAGGDS